MEDYQSGEHCDYDDKNDDNDDDDDSDDDNDEGDDVNGEDDDSDCNDDNLSINDDDNNVGDVHIFQFQVLTSPRYEHTVASIPVSKVMLSIDEDDIFVFWGSLLRC